MFRAIRRGYHRSASGPDFDTYNRIEVSSSAILHNLHFFHSLDGLDVIPVIKSNAYGHGIELAAHIIAGAGFPWVPYVAVDNYYEAQRVRAIARQQPVLILGMIKPQNFAHLQYRYFSFVVSDATTIQALGQIGRPVKVHLELNTGMNRYGVRPSEALELADLCRKYPYITVEGIMTHLADSNGTQHHTVNDAVNEFDAIAEAIEARIGKVRYKHIAQTAGSVRTHSLTANAIRPGIGVFGVNPFPLYHDSYSSLEKLRPAMRMISTIAQVHEVLEGEGIGYNYSFKAPSDMRIGILPTGYYEGIPLELGNSGWVMCAGERLPIVGKVCMNHTMVDITNSRATVGDEVDIFSNVRDADNSIESIARMHDLFSYSLLAKIASDIKRVKVE